VLIEDFKSQKAIYTTEGTMKEYRTVFKALNDYQRISNATLSLSEQEARFHRQPAEGDEGHGKHPDGSGKATAENEEAVDDPLLHGDHSAPGLHHGFGFEGRGAGIVPEEGGDRRRRKRRSR